MTGAPARSTAVLSARQRARGPAASPHQRRRGTGRLTTIPLPQTNAFVMIRRRAAAADIAAKIGNHSFRATGITAYLEAGGTLENALTMAAHESPRTTKLCDRSKDRLTQSEVEKIRL